MIPIKGCTLTLYEHHRDAGIVHTFTNDGSPNNENLLFLDWLIMFQATNVHVNEIFKLKFIS